MIKKLLFLAVLLQALFLSTYAQTLTVTGSTNANNLAQILAGSGVTVTNAVLTGAANSSGTFNTTGNPIGISSGILLTSGQVANAVGPNNLTGAGTDNGTVGDPNLDNITSSTQDAAVLEFDVTPIGNSISFNYVFGSDEYPEYVCSNFNDVFAFFITGPIPGGGTYNSQNIALIPSSTLPVAINTVNPGVAGANSGGGSCTSLAFSTYYNNNTGGQAVQYDGWTDVFTAQAAVVPCQSYHLKLAIGDVGDGSFDSGVFLEGNSFNSQGTTVSSAVVSPGYTSTFEGCVNGTFNITLPQPAIASTVLTYTITGTATNGSDYATLPGTIGVPFGSTTVSIPLNPIQDGITEGVETVTINIINPCDGSIYSSATLNITDVPDFSISANPNPVCPGQLVQLNATGGYTYAWSPPGQVSNATIANPTTNPTATNTYSVTATVGSCSSNGSVTVNVSSLSVQTAVSPNTTICPGTIDTLGAGASGGTTPYTFAWSPSSNLTHPDSAITTAIQNASGTYVITVTDAEGCTVTGSVNVNVYTLPAVTLGPDQFFCPGTGPAILSVPGYDTYSWNTGSTTDTIHAADGSYWVTVYSAALGNCPILSDTIDITYYPQSVASLSDTGMCPGETIDLSIDNGFTNPVWSTSETTSSIAVSTNGTFYYTATDGNGCLVNSDTITVTIGTPPAVNATASPDTICPGSTTTLSSGALTGLDYLWTPTNEVTSSINVTSAGVYIIRVRDAYCASFDTVEVFEYQHAPILLDQDAFRCNGDSVALSAPSGSPYLSYDWSNGDTTATTTAYTSGDYWVIVNDGQCDYTSDTFTLTYYPVTHPEAFNDTTLCQGQTFVVTSSTGLSNYLWSTTETTSSISVNTTGLYSYTATDANNCPASSDTAAVTFVGPPVANVTANPDTICAGGTTTLNSGAGSGLQYAWLPNGENTETITANTAGQYIVTVSAGSCSSSDTIQIYQYSHAPILLGNDTSVCPNASVILSPSGAPYVSYSWSNTLQTATITVTNAGNYWVTVNDGNCDYVSDTLTVSNFQVSNPTAYSDTNVCAGQPVALSGDAGYSNYTWNGTLSGQNITVTQTGNYSFTATDANGCSVQSNNVIVSNRPYPNANITATPPAICIGTGSSTLNAGSEAGVTYTWAGNGTGNTIQVTQPGDYTVIADNNGCISFDTITIVASPVPVVSLPEFISTCCETVVLDPAPGQNYTYSWNNQSTGSTLTVTTTNNGTDTYSVTATNTDGCTAAAQTSVSIKCIDAAAFATPDTVLYGDSSVLSVTTAYAGTFTYNWVPVTGLTNQTSSNPTATPSDITTYNVIVTDNEFECIDTAQIIVYVVYPDNIAVPNAFTPNRDGKNDYFYPVLLGSYQTVTEFRVYNRWGARIHNSTDPWDGTIDSKEQPAGTYIYYLVVRVPDQDNAGATKDIKLEGSFSLLR